MLSSKKPAVEKYFVPIADRLYLVNPNILTLLGSIPPLLFFVFVIFHLYALAIIAFFGNLIDLLDGMIARKYGKVTNFGGFLDSTLDRVSDFLTITAFSFGKIVRWEIVAPLLLFAYLTSYTRAHGELRSGNKVNFAIGVVERPERLVLIFVSLILYLLFQNTIIGGFNIAELIFILLTFLSFYTTLQRIVRAYKKL